MANDGKLYGLERNSYGGTFGSTPTGGGVLFSYSIDDSATTGLIVLPDYAFPMGSLIQATNGNLYGMTSYDGLNVGGTIFSYNIDSVTYTTLYSLPDSAFPFGSLLQVGTDTLYGMTQYDGANKGGTIFCYIMSTNNYAVLVNLPPMAHPTGSLIKASNGLLYGMTFKDGYYSSGTIFSYSIQTGIFDTIHNFGLGHGAYPYGDLIQASDGNLYGMTSNGGFGSGIIFRYTIGNGLYNIDVSFTGSSGGNPLYGHLTEYRPATALQPNSTSACAGSVVRFSALDSFAAAPVQWQVSINGGSDFSNIASATDTVYSFTSSAAQNGYQYRAIFTYPFYSDTSRAAVLTVLPPDTMNINSSICYGQSISIFGHSISVSGIYTDTIPGGSVSGCDSIILYHLTVYPVSAATESVQICNSQSYTFGTHTYTAPGSYIDTLQGAAVYGCDSIINLNLTVNPLPVVSWQQTDTSLINFCGQWIENPDSLHGGMPAGGYYSGLFVIADSLVVPQSYLDAYMNRSDSIFTLLYNYTDSNSCYAAAMQNFIIRVGCEGINTSSSTSAINIYPNPTTGIFTIENNYPGALTIQILNLIGEISKTFTMSGTQQAFNISDLASGIYEVQISNEKQRLKVMKLVKE